MYRLFYSIENSAYVQIETFQTFKEAAEFAMTLPEGSVMEIIKND
jgi:hypothetical protein